MGAIRCDPRRGYSHTNHQQTKFVLVIVLSEAVLEIVIDSTSVDYDYEHEHEKAEEREG
ncbi:hypothetical protein OAS39_03210 [Pirellulales bacterium]|nr:hypothetical protein [Pirellulales bacterium]